MLRFEFCNESLKTISMWSKCSFISLINVIFSNKSIMLVSQIIRWHSGLRSTLNSNEQVWEHWLCLKLNTIILTEDLFLCMYNCPSLWIHEAPALGMRWWFPLTTTGKIIQWIYGIQRHILTWMLFTCALTEIHNLPESSLLMVYITDISTWRTGFLRNHIFYLHLFI